MSAVAAGAHVIGADDAAEIPSWAFFDSTSRAEAIAGALPLLATYFVAGSSWSLTSQAALSSVGADAVDAELARAIRLRVLLALGRRLEPILHAVVDHASFRYRQRSDESVGLIAGRLDIHRYVRERGGLNAPRRYPIRVTERHIATAENILAAGALMALLDALADAPAELLPSGASPEQQELQALRASLLRLQQLPLFAGLRADARRVANTARLRRQRDDVTRRLQRRDIAHPAPYRDLVSWVADFLVGSAPLSADQAWAFYDERFDPRLFEIWTLAQLLDGLVDLLGPPTDAPKPLWDRSSAVWASWSTPYGALDLYFQRSAATFGAQRHWKLTAPAHVLGAIPDIAFRVTRSDDGVEHFLLDCKLRRRRPLPAVAGAPLDLPSDEIYKMLGYFEHLRSKARPQGALVYYTPAAARTALMESDEAEHEDRGRLALAGVDPAVDCSSAFKTIATLIAARLGVPSPEIQEAATAASVQALDEGLDEVEAHVAYKQTLMTGVLDAYARRHSDQLPALQKLTSNSLAPGTWATLDDQTKWMLLSAELYGSQQAEKLDHSGPLLGLCAACERELNLRLYARARAAYPQEINANDKPVIPDHPTLGTGQFVLQKALRIMKARKKGDEAAEQAVLDGAQDEDARRFWTLIAEYLLAADVDLDKLKVLSDQLRKLNMAYRRVAAHDEAIETDVWAGGRDAIFGRDRVLSHLAATLPFA